MDGIKERREKNKRRQVEIQREERRRVLGRVETGKRSPRFRELVAVC
jgi:hypothetical protein